MGKLTAARSNQPADRQSSNCIRGVYTGAFGGQVRDIEKSLRPGDYIIRAPVQGRFVAVTSFAVDVFSSAFSGEREIRPPWFLPLAGVAAALV